MKKVYFFFLSISFISVACNNNQPKVINNIHDTHYEKVDSGGSISKAVNDTTDIFKKNEEQESLKESDETELPSENKKTVEPKETVECECKRRFDISENEFISMRITPQKISANSMVYLILENHTKGDVMYGREYSLEYFDGNNWIPMTAGLLWTQEGYFLFAGKTKNIEMESFYLFIEKYNFKKGKYRIIKNIASQDIWNYNLCDEFEIE